MNQFTSWWNKFIMDYINSTSCPSYLIVMFANSFLFFKFLYRYCHLSKGRFMTPSTMLFSWNQSLSLLLDILYTIDLKVFHFPSTVPTGVSVSLSFSEACRSSLTLLILIMMVVSFLIGILSFLILFLTYSWVVDMIITWSVLQLASLISLAFWNFWQITLSQDDADEVQVFGYGVHPRILVNIFHVIYSMLYIYIFHAI